LAKSTCRMSKPRPTPVGTSPLSTVDGQFKLSIGSKLAERYPAAVWLESASPEAGHRHCPCKWPRAGSVFGRDNWPATGNSCCRCRLAAPDERHGVAQKRPISADTPCVTPVVAVPGQLRRPDLLPPYVPNSPTPGVWASVAAATRSADKRSATAPTPAHGSSPPASPAAPAHPCGDADTFRRPSCPRSTRTPRVGRRFGNRRRRWVCEGLWFMEMTLARSDRRGHESAS
jgi:hypothetical protein